MNIKLVNCFLNLLENLWLQAVLTLILLDIFTGIFKAIKFKKLNSSFGIQGLGKHLAFFFVAIFSTYFLKAINMSFWIYVIYFIYVIFYLTSICENAYEAGWRTPKFLLKNLLIYQKAIDEGNLSLVFKAISKVKKGDITTKDIERKTTLSADESRILRELLEKADLINKKEEI